MRDYSWVDPTKMSRFTYFAKGVFYLLRNNSHW